jgi:hypothetical protein
MKGSISVSFCDNGTTMSVDLPNLNRTLTGFKDGSIAESMGRIGESRG